MVRSEFYEVRLSDLSKLKRYKRSTKCHKCSKNIEVGDMIRRSGNNTYHRECYTRSFQ